MGYIKIDPKFQKSEAIASLFLAMFELERIKLPKLSLPEILLAKTRTGMDSDSISTSVISRFSEVGIPSGPLENGQANVMEMYTSVMMEEIVDSIHMDLRIDGAVDSGMIVNTAGANAAGPVASVGANASPHTSTGVAS